MTHGLLRRLPLDALSILALSCGSASRPVPPPVAGPADVGAREADGGGPETMHTLAEAQCPGASVKAVWKGVTVSAEPPYDDVRSLRLRFEDGTDIELQAPGPHDWTELVFSSDCRRVAFLRTRRGPVEIIPTRDLRAYARGEHVQVRYVDDQVPCQIGFTYSDLRWVSDDTIMYRAGGDPYKTRRANVDRAPDHHEHRPCLDPTHPLYEGPADAGGPG